VLLGAREVVLGEPAPGVGVRIDGELRALLQLAAKCVASGCAGLLETSDGIGEVGRLTLALTAPHLGL